MPNSKVLATSPLARMRIFLSTLQSCDQGMSLQAAHMFVLIANYETVDLGLTTADVAAAMTISPTATSRMIYYLGEGIPSSGIKGLNLVELRIDSTDRRRRTIHLTEKGKALIDQLLEQAGL